MNVTIIGCGYVGLVMGACLADLGNQVFCLDLDARKIGRLQAGDVPIHEPGLAALVARGLQAGRLRFSADVAASVDHATLQCIAVDAPAQALGAIALQDVFMAARNIGRHMRGFKVIVNKSTVPVGTAERIGAAMREELQRRFTGQAPPSFTVVSNPEFLKEGAAVEDFSRPDRIVLGLDADPQGQAALALLRQLYQPFNRNRERTHVMDVRSAEFTKYAANAMLATRISFMNEMAMLAETVGADIEQVRQGLGADARIGHGFLYAGAGYGGSCLPKDVQALLHTAREHGHSLRILQAVDAVNENQKHVLVGKLQARLGDDLTGLRIAVWGLAFKPDTGDMRNAPSRVLVRALLEAGATVVAHDPVAGAEARAAFAHDLAAVPALSGRLEFAAQPQDAARGADALVIVTEWKAYRSPDWAALKLAMKSPIVFDGRNLFEPAVLQGEGFEYHGIGRGRA